MLITILFPADNKKFNNIQNPMYKNIQLYIILKVNIKDFT